MTKLCLFLSLINLGFFEIESEISSYFKSLLKNDKNRALHIPCILPTDTYVSTSVSSLYGLRNHPILKKVIHHDGIDISVRNANVIATAKGKVTKVGYSKGYGKHIIINHLNGYTTLYGHLSEIFVEENAKVDIAQSIGISGTSGLVTGEHIHYEVHLKNKPVNPISYLLLLYDSLYRNL